LAHWRFKIWFGFLFYPLRLGGSIIQFSLLLSVPLWLIISFLGVLAVHAPGLDLLASVGVFRVLPDCVVFLSAAIGGHRRFIPLVLDLIDFVRAFRVLPWLIS
jgi:hypothetical protein